MMTGGCFCPPPSSGLAFGAGFCLLRGIKKNGNRRGCGNQPFAEMIMKRRFFFLAVLLVIMAAGKLTATADDGPPGNKSYDAHGVVRQIATDRHTVTIQHEAIAGYMPAMTMEFPVKDTNQFNGISSSDEIAFKLVVGEHDSWVEDVRLVAHRIEDVTNHMVIIHVPTAELMPGDRLPNYELTAEDGSRVHISDFRGRVLAFTFFFTRCPLPDFCPRMSQDFAETRKLMVNTPGGPTNWQFLSISFDPEFDQPAALSSYANYFREGNSDRWLFAVAATNTLASLAPKLDLMVLHEGDGISHNLRTVVLDPQGKIFRQFDGNQWLPQKLAEAMLEAARPPTNSTSQ
jgi:protein SCO1